MHVPFETFMGIARNLLLHDTLVACVENANLLEVARFEIFAVVSWLEMLASTADLQDSKQVSQALVSLDDGSDITCVKLQAPRVVSHKIRLSQSIEVVSNLSIEFVDVSRSIGQSIRRIRIPYTEALPVICSVPWRSQEV